MIIRTGIQSIDEFCGGLQSGTLTILTGTAGCAATSFALNIANTIAKTANVFFLSRIYKHSEGLHDNILFNCTEYYSNNTADVPEKSPIVTEIEKQIAENDIHALFIVQSTQKTSFLSLAEELSTDKMNQSEKMQLIVKTFKTVALEHDIPVFIFWEINHLERKDTKLTECLHFGNDSLPQPDYVYELECISRNETNKTSMEKIKLTNTATNIFTEVDLVFHFDKGTWEEA